MKGYDFYTVNLGSTTNAEGITGGSITYSEIMCGDCIRPVADCGCLE